MVQTMRFSITILDRYLAREILTAWLTVLLVLLVIVLSTETVHLLSWITQGFIPVSAFLAYLVNSMFQFSVILVPLSLLMGILLGFGRLYKDSEMTAIMSAGMGPLQWYRSLLLVVIPTTVLVVILSLFIKPMMEHQRAVITAKVSSRSEIDSLLVGQFNRASQGGAVLFLEAEGKNNKQRKNTFFQQEKDNKTQVDVAASSSSYIDKNGNRYMVMHHGVQYVGNAGEAAMKIIEYDDYGLHIDKKEVAVHSSASTKSMRELWASSIPKDKAELQWRISIPIAALIVSLIALPLSKTSPRSGRYSKLVLALILYLVYSNLISMAYSWIIQQKIPAWIGIWWVHILAVIFLFILLKSSGYIGVNTKRLVTKHGA